MSRVSDALLGDTAFARNSNQVLLYPKYGGQFGYAAKYDEWISNQAYVRRNLIPVVHEMPKFFRLMPDANKWYASCRAIMEEHPQTIEGFQAGLTVEIDEHAFAGAGEFQQEFIDVKRARSKPSFTWTEKYGNPLQNFFDAWIRYGMMDPETKYALVGTLTGERPDDMLADMYSMTMLFIEPDPTGRKAVKAWLTTNMFPTSNGDIIGKRDLTSAHELTKLNIEFTGLSQFGTGVTKYAQKVLDAIIMTNANPYNRAAFLNSISSEVPTDVGYQHGVEQLIQNQV